VGVLTALAAEQIVENAHWAHRVAETQAQLKRELSGDADSGLIWLSHARCLDLQLAALRDGVLEARRTGMFHATTRRYSPSLVKFTSEAWLNARSLQVSDHMSGERVAAYSAVYFYPTELVGNITTLHSLAGELEPLAHDLDHVSPTEADELIAKIGRIQELQTRTALAMILMIRGSDKLGAPIHPPAADISETDRVCAMESASVLKVLRDPSIKSAEERVRKLGLSGLLES
jgi:hypothetical protein